MTNRVKDTGVEPDQRAPRVLVVGASAGIGRHLALAAASSGAEVMVAARRKDVLDDLVAEAGAGRAVAADVCTPEGRSALVDSVRSAVGSLDLVVSTIGYASLSRLVDSNDDDWRRTFDINVLSVQALVRDLVGLVEPGGIVSVLSSESARRPRPGLVAYAASKAALEVVLEGWRIEHPTVRFSSVAVGATFPTEFGAEFDAELLAPMLELWQRQGLMQDSFMHPREVGRLLFDTYRSALAHPGVGIEHLVLRSPSPVAGSLDEALGLDSSRGR